jgi:hypothetical protein
MVTFVEQNLMVILPYFPYKSLGRSYDSKFCSRDFILRINLTTLFLTKTYLLNTIKPFLDHENRSLGKTKQNLEKPLLGGYP